MPGLTRDRRHEQGAVAVIVSVALPVLLGFAAFAVDTSSIHSAEVIAQNAADAAALAIAADCADGNCGDPAVTAARFAAGNQADGATAVLDLDNQTVTVEAHVKTFTLFGGLYGLKEGVVTKSAQAGWWSGVGRLIS